MNSKKIVAIALILGGLIFGYLGADQVANSSASVNVLGVEVNATDNSGQTQGYIFLGLGVLLVFGGIYTINKK